MTQDSGPQTGSLRAVSYLVAPEVTDYLAIMTVLEASMTDLTPAEIRAALARDGVTLDEGVLVGRLDQLRDWGAVTARTDTSQLTRVADLMARNWRYVATPAGKQVHRFALTTLVNTPAMRDIPLTSLRQVVEALEQLAALDPTDPAATRRVAEVTRALFDAHDAIDNALVGAEDTLAALADRFDLDDDDALELKTLLVEYATRVASELEAATARAYVAATRLEPAFDALAAATVAASEGATLIERGTLLASRGGTRSDWEQLVAWCSPQTGRAARFTGRLVRSMPSMHANLRRLHSTSGAATSKQRALTLARACLDPDHGPALFLAALGDHPWRKLAHEADDTDLGRTPSWAAGPKVDVPPLLRNWGRTGQRGRAPAAKDDTQAREEIAARRAERAAAHAAAVREVLEAPAGAPLSDPAARTALAALLAAARTPPTGGRRTGTVDGLACTLVPTPDTTGTVLAPEWAVHLPGRTPVFHRPGAQVTTAPAPRQATVTETVA